MRKERRNRPAAHDGRVRRGVQSRQRIVDALVDLVGRGEVQPTAQQVADQAGVGIRTVFRHFTEMELLYQSMDARLEGEVRPLLRRVPRDGSLTERIAGLTAQRATFFERIAPYKRSANRLRWRSPFLQQRHAYVVAELRTDLQSWLPELSERPDAVVEAVDLLTSFDVWDRLRSDQRLNQKAAVAVVDAAITALLGTAGVEPRSAEARMGANDVARRRPEPVGRRRKG